MDDPRSDGSISIFSIPGALIGKYVVTDGIVVPPRTVNDLRDPLGHLQAEAATGH